MAESKKDTTLLDYDVDFKHRVMWLGSQKVSSSGEESGVDTSLAEKAIKSIYLLNKQNPSGDNPIEVIMHNPGGDWYAGMAIYSAIKNSKCPVTIRVTGLAASMATVILQAAPKRLMDKYATIMLHTGHSEFSGHTKTFISWAEEEKRVCKIMNNIYLEKIREAKPKFTYKQLESLLHFDKWMTADQALEYGLIDGIL